MAAVSVAGAEQLGAGLALPAGEGSTSWLARGEPYPATSPRKYACALIEKLDARVLINEGLRLHRLKVAFFVKSHSTGFFSSPKKGRKPLTAREGAVPAAL